MVVVAAEQEEVCICALPAVTAFQSQDSNSRLRSSVKPPQRLRLVNLMASMKLLDLIEVPCWLQVFDRREPS